MLCYGLILSFKNIVYIYKCKHTKGMQKCINTGLSWFYSGSSLLMNIKVYFFYHFFFYKMMRLSYTPFTLFFFFIPENGIARSKGMPQKLWVQFSRSVVSDSLRPYGLQHARPPCPSPTPGAYSNSCPTSRWCYPTISSSVVPFSSLKLWVPLDNLHFKMSFSSNFQQKCKRISILTLCNNGIFQIQRD